jgi:hypothetical protein
MTAQANMPHTIANLLLLTNLAATLFMTGVIWVVQIVHYPLFAGVGQEVFPMYAADHNTLITLVVMPAMLMELGSAALLVLLRPAGFPLWAGVAGLVLVVLIWGATFFVSVPQHSVLLSGFDATAHRTLVSTNWLRTTLWSGRSLLMLGLTARLLL